MQSRKTSRQKRTFWELRHGQKFERHTLANGLTPEKVVQKIRMSRSYAVDISSDIEAGSGKKVTCEATILMKSVSRCGLKNKPEFFEFRQLFNRSFYEPLNNETHSVRGKKCEKR